MTEQLTIELAAEAARIAFLRERDGDLHARRWVERTLKIYRNAVHSTGNHASLPHYRPLFEDSIRDFEQWLARC